MPIKRFAKPREVKFSDEEKIDIANYVLGTYRDGVMSRNKWNSDHSTYEDMWRGRHNLNRPGPFEGSANFHVQAPYWIVDSLNVRSVMSVWQNRPLVTCSWQEENDEKKAIRASHLVEYHLTHPLMQARDAWSRGSKIRFCHGTSMFMVAYVKDDYEVRVQGDTEGVVQYEIDKETGLPVEDANGLPVRRIVDPDAAVEKLTYYNGPIVTPLGWDDVVMPLGCMNPQPLRKSNPGGAPWVNIRQYEPLWLMMDKAESGVYSDMLAGERDEAWWINRSGNQTRSGSGMSAGNQSASRLDDRAEGVTRALAPNNRSSKNPNPETEVITHFGKWKNPATGKREEMVFFVSVEPEMYLGGFVLSDWYWKGERPLLDLHFQKTGTRFYSMGAMEICRRLSDELDTIHNMRLDVGFLTNMPFFFYRASSAFNPNKIKLKPMKGIPVDDPKDFVFPQFNNVTSFFDKEEATTLSILERVMGITDLFLGVSPTRGAAQRHATGFVGVQQESEARMSEVLAQDAEAFSRLCRLIYNMEFQYGPKSRSFRLEGEESVVKYDQLSLQDIWMEGEYDFKLGNTGGAYSQVTRQQQARELYSLLINDPIVNSDIGRRWEVLNAAVGAIGIRDADKYIGRKENVAPPPPKTQEEENGAMAQSAFGMGQPAPVHPADNDRDHMTKAVMFIQSEDYKELGQPNIQGFMSHIQLHSSQEQAKRLQAAQMQLMGMSGGQQMNTQPIMQGPGGSQTQTLTPKPADQNSFG